MEKIVRFIVDVNKDVGNYGDTIDNFLYPKDMVDFYNDKTEKVLLLTEKKNIFQVVEESKDNDKLGNIVEVLKVLVELLVLVSIAMVRMGISDSNGIGNTSVKMERFSKEVVDDMDKVVSLVLKNAEENVIENTKVPDKDMGRVDGIEAAN